MNKSVRGTLRESNGFYRIIISYYEDNKRKQKTISTGLKISNNKRKAEALLQQEVEKFISNLNTEQFFGNKVLFIDWLDKWLEFKKLEITENTFDTYSAVMAKHIKPYFKGKLLTDLKPKHFDEYYRKCSQTLTVQSIRKHSMIINQALDKAVMLEYITHNPCASVKIPRAVNKVVKEKVVLSASEAKRMLDVMQGERLYPIIALTLLYGLRKEEVLGLTWDDIDFKKKEITINNTVTRSAKSVVRFNSKKLKTNKSHRTFPFVCNVESLLREVKLQQSYYKKELLCDYIDNEYNLVFTYEDGRIYNPDYISRKFGKLVKHYNFNKMRFYDLRHTCASIMRDKDIPIESISLWLGHSDISTTTDIYIHKDKDINNTTGSMIQEIYKVS